jgi:hypothetical protein
MSTKVIQGIFGNVARNHLIRQAMTDIPHGPDEQLYTNGRAVIWSAKKPFGWSAFNRGQMHIIKPEPPCAA